MPDKDKGGMLSKLTPGQKRYGAIGLAILAAAGVMFGADQFVTPTEQTKGPKPEDVNHNVFTTTNSREYSIESLGASVQRLRREISDFNQTLKGTLERQKKVTERLEQLESEQARQRASLGQLKTDSENSRTQLQSEISKSSDSLKDLISNSKPSESDGALAPSSFSTPQSRKGVASPAKKGVANPGDLFTEADSEKPTITLEQEEEDSPEEPPLKISVINGAPPEAEKIAIAEKKAEAAKAKEERELDFFLPVGTIISGVLLNGVDASTSSGAKSEPMPALIRVDKSAILPNRYTTDIKDCFLLVSGHGDLSSERAFLRGESFSCVRNDGGIIETSIPSYAVGEDGKAGLRGRLVSKQGQIIAKSLLSGFASGMASAFRMNPVTTLATSASSTMEYQSLISEKSVQGAFAEGAANALSKVAEFYIKMAEQIFPVVEITAGRKVNVIVTRGSYLRLVQTNRLDTPKSSSPLGGKK